MSLKTNATWVQEFQVIITNCDKTINSNCFITDNSNLSLLTSAFNKQVYFNYFFVNKKIFPENYENSIQYNIESFSNKIDFR